MRRLPVVRSGRLMGAVGDNRNQAKPAARLGTERWS